MSAKDSLGPQFQQLQLLMTPKELGNLHAGDYGDSMKGVTQGVLAGDARVRAIGQTLPEHGVERPVSVVHVPADQQGYDYEHRGHQVRASSTTLYDGHHRVSAAMTHNQLVPVHHYEWADRRRIDYGD